jgi:transposase
MKDQFPFSQVVAVDVAKTTLDFAFADSNQTLSIDNDSDPIVSQLIGRIKNPQTTMVVMEATGGYEELLVTRLHQHRIAVAVVNPRRVRDFASRIGKDAKV